MFTRLLLIAIASSCLLASPSRAQNQAAPPRNHGGQHGGGSAGGPSGIPGSIGGARSPFTGGARGPVGWGAFHHDTAQARVTPHRFGATNLPRPNVWNGNIHNFDLGRWQGGQWQHVNHNGRVGWWWVVGPDWYFFDAPVYPYPDLYTPLGEPFSWWYWCDTYAEYYPYVTFCPVPWESVMPRD